MAHEELNKLAGGMLCYRYALDEDATTRHETFQIAEVPEPYRQRFREEIDRENWIIQFGRPLPEAPYKADFVICTSDAAF